MNDFASNKPNLNIFSIFRLKSIPYPIAFLLLGAYSIAVQVLLIREFFVIFFGNELCMGIIFSAWLVSIFIGAILGGWIVSRINRVLTLFILFQYLLILIPAIQIILIRNLRLLLNVSSGEYVPFTLMVGSILGVLFPFSFFIGFIFPFAISIYPDLSKNPARGIGFVYVCESVGSTIGGAALTFYLILHYPPYQIIAFFTLLVLFNSLFLTREIKEKLLRILFLFIWVVFILGWTGFTYFGFWGWIENVTIHQRWKTINPQMKLLESADSPYQNIVVAKIADQYNIYGNGQYLASFPNPFQTATQAHFILSQHPHPEKVLLIGGGIGGMVREILKHPVKTLHYVELDAKLIQIARKYLPQEDEKAFSAPGVKIFLSDGRYFVKKCRDKYDVIIIHLPDPSTAMLNRFYTLDFFQETARILKPDGLLVTGVSSAVNYIGPEVGNYTSSIYHSLAKVFPYVLVTPGDYNFFFASFKPGIATSDTKILTQRYLSRKISTPYFSHHLFQLLLPPERVEFINKAIKGFPVRYYNTDTQPISYFYNLILWDLFSGGKGRKFFTKLEGLSWEWYFFSLILIIVLRFTYIHISKRTSPIKELKFVSLYAIFSTGFAGMGLEIILLFTYQNMYGYLYQKIGIIVALFMAGLAVGAQVMNHSISRSSYNWHKVLLGIEIAITCFSVSLPFLVKIVFRMQEWHFPSGEPLFMSLVMVAGILAGSEFPLVNEILIKGRIEVGRSAGLVDSFDHLGACMGAALTGTLLVPLLGTIQSSLYIAALNLISCLFVGSFVIRGKADFSYRQLIW